MDEFAKLTNEAFNEFVGANENYSIDSTHVEQQQGIPGWKAARAAAILEDGAYAVEELCTTRCASTPRRRPCRARRRGAP